MKHGVVTAFVIFLVMSAVVQKGDSFIRAGREMNSKQEGEPQQPAEDFYDRITALLPAALFKKG